MPAAFDSWVVMGTTATFMAAPRSTPLETDRSQNRSKPWY